VHQNRRLGVRCFEEPPAELTLFLMWLRVTYMHINETFCWMWIKLLRVVVCQM